MMMKPLPVATAPDWADMLIDAVNEPGKLVEAHKFFHKFSFSNQWLASRQIRKMGLPLAPINTFKRWLSVDRPVQKGQHASVALIMPVPVKSKEKMEDGTEESKVLFTRFQLRKAWFHLSQTDGADYVVEDVADTDWSLESALDILDLGQVPYEFSGVNDTTRIGRVRDGRLISISPLSTTPTLDGIRLVSSILLGHTAATPGKNVPEDPATRVLEQEAAAYLCGAALGVQGIDEARGTIQANLEGANRLSDKVASRAFGAADRILNAGRVH